MAEWFNAEWFKQYSTAIIALGGVLLGSLVTGGLTFLNGWVMRNRDLKLKLWERFLDHRIAAHESVVAIALKMRRMVPLGRFEKGEVVRSPQMMMSREGFDQWLGEFAEIAGPASTWLSTPVKRELNFAQDYFMTVHRNLLPFPSECFPEVGSVIRQDFIDLSSKLEKLAFEYFKEEALDLRLNDLTEWHKYPRSETDARLRGTVILQKWAEIESMLQTAQPPT